MYSTLNMYLNHRHGLLGRALLHPSRLGSSQHPSGGRKRLQGGWLRAGQSHQGGHLQPSGRDKVPHQVDGTRGCAVQPVHHQVGCVVVRDSHVRDHDKGIHALPWDEQQVGLSCALSMKYCSWFMCACLWECVHVCVWGTKWCVLFDLCAIVRVYVKCEFSSNGCVKGISRRWWRNAFGILLTLFVLLPAHFIIVPVLSPTHYSYYLPTPLPSSHHHTV